ncbi:hypothetical protein [Gottfriedia acidiceleris]|uniref:hypothetical protein n=1 Tax=Gottfriedia acidiceleris TaxID=371036 RepID=UPI003000D94D
MNIKLIENDTKPIITFYDGISLTQYVDLSKRRKEVLAIVNKEVFKYITDDNLCFDDKDEAELFPLRRKLTGNYYIKAVSYSKRVSPIGFQIMVEVRSTEYSPTGEDDYLGLDVTLFTSSENDDLEVWGMDSYSI